MALNVEQCREMLEVARAEGMIFMEAFMYRFHPQIFKVEELIQEGRIGEVKLIRGTFSFILEDETNIRMVQGLGGGSLMDVGCYPIHLSNLIYGELPVKVKATGVYRPDSLLMLTFPCAVSWSIQAGVWRCLTAVLSWKIGRW
jgi:xylose dehydrogenase (NAD/NADP)